MKNLRLLSIEYISESSHHVPHEVVGMYAMKNFSIGPYIGGQNKVTRKEQLILQYEIDGKKLSQDILPIGWINLRYSLSRIKSQETANCFFIKMQHDYEEGKIKIPLLESGYLKSISWID